MQNLKTHLHLNNLPLNQLPLNKPALNQPTLIHTPVRYQHLLPLLTQQNQHPPQILKTRYAQGHQHQIGLVLPPNLIFNKQGNMRGN
jgi:hypothetical protein